RVDVDRSAIPLTHRVDAMPTYIVFDPEERERVRMVGAKPFDVFYDAMAQVRLSAPAFLRAAELLDAKKDVDANLLVGNTYSHLGLTDQARTAYQQARKAALQSGDKSPAQLAEALSAFTFVRDDDPARAITLLQKLSATPTSPENESLIWLSIGNAYRAALDPKSAADAFQRAGAVAPADSAAQREANAAKAAAIAAQNDPIESELRRLQGKWVPVRLEADGKAIEGRKAGPAVSIRFARWVEKPAAGESSSKFTIDPLTDPKHINLMHQLAQGMISLPGIYVLDGDTLKISMAFPFAGRTEGLKKRPAVFATRPGDDFVVTTYQRAPSPK
ncbi:MAG TPA: TIGR03067 domain-containing protein, partial [Thermoanaerobaculia bacterium]